MANGHNFAHHILADRKRWGQSYCRTCQAEHDAAYRAKKES